MKDDIANILIQMLSLPFGAELNLSIPEQTLEKIIQKYAKGKLAITGLHCFDGYISFDAKKGKLPKYNIQIRIEEVTLNRSQLIISYSEKKGNLSNVGSMLGKLPFMHLPISVSGDKQFQLNLSHRWQQKMKNQPEAILGLMDKLKLQVLMTLGALELKIMIEQD